MLVRKVTASPKGQFTIPVDMLRALGGGKRAMDLVLVQDGSRIIVTPAAEVGQAIVDDLKDWPALAAPGFANLWDNPADEVWDDA